MAIQGTNPPARKIIVILDCDRTSVVFIHGGAVIGSRVLSSNLFSFVSACSALIVTLIGPEKCMTELFQRTSIECEYADKPPVE
jgi:hypothetical protein